MQRYLSQVTDAKNKTDGIKYVGLSTAVQSRDGVEERIETSDIRTIPVGLEALESHFLYMHLGENEVRTLESESPATINWKYD